MQPSARRHRPRPATGRPATGSAAPGCARVRPATPPRRPATQHRRRRPVDPHRTVLACPYRRGALPVIAEGQERVPDPHCRPARELGHLVADRCAVDRGAVGRVEVLDDDGPVVDGNQQVLARHVGVTEHEVTTRPAADDDLPIAKRLEPAGTAPADDIEGQPGRRRVRRRRRAISSHSQGRAPSRTRSWTRLPPTQRAAPNTCGAAAASVAKGTGSGLNTAMSRSPPAPSRTVEVDAHPPQSGAAPILRCGRSAGCGWCGRCPQAPNAAPASASAPSSLTATHAAALPGLDERNVPCPA